MLELRTYTEAELPSLEAALEKEISRLLALAEQARKLRLSANRRARYSQEVGQQTPGGASIAADVPPARRRGRKPKTTDKGVA